MYKSQLQELAQRSCFNLPCYTCIREGPDHAPRFKAVVNFNGESFDCPQYYTTLRQAEHAAAEAALNALSSRGPSHSLAARILDESGVYKNLLQEIAQRVSAPLPKYTTFRSGLGHQPVFTGTVLLAGITFTGEPAKNKKQAEKNAALAAWLSLKQLARQDVSTTLSEQEGSDEQEQIKIARALLNYNLKEKKETAAHSSNPTVPFQEKFALLTPRPASPKKHPSTTSKILPLFFQRASHRGRVPTTAATDSPPVPPLSQPAAPDARAALRPHRPFPTTSSTSYIPIRHPAPPVSVRTGTPVYSAARFPLQLAQPVCIRQAVPVFAAPPPPPPPTRPEKTEVDKGSSSTSNDLQHSEAMKKSLEQLKI